MAYSLLPEALLRLFLGEGRSEADENPGLRVKRELSQQSQLPPNARTKYGLDQIQAPGHFRQNGSVSSQAQEIPHQQGRTMLLIASICRKKLLHLCFKIFEISGTQGGNWGRDTGEIAFEQQSHHGNGLVSLQIKSSQASKPNICRIGMSVILIGKFNPQDCQCR